MDNLMVSINCITYNHENYIRDAVEGFLMQKTNFKFEILIHDDASTDKTAEIIKEYHHRYPELIKPIYQIENQYSKGINPAVINNNRAKGKYIAFCEGDDYWANPYKLQKQVDFMERNPDYTLIAHQANRINVEGIELGQFSPFTEGEITVEEFLKENGGYFPTASLVVKRDIMLKEYPDFYHVAPVGDWPLTLWYGLNGKMYFLNETMSVYRVGVESSWTNKVKNNPDFFINVNYGILDMLESFDNYTKGKYKDVLDGLFSYYRKSLYIKDNCNFINRKAYHEDVRENINSDLACIDRDKDIYLFGASQLGKVIFNLLKGFNISVNGFLDNSSHKIGKEYLGLQVYHLNEFKNKENFQIIIASSYSDEIEKQLLDFGLKKSMDFVNLKEILFEY